LQFALGPLGLKPDEFWRLTWADFCRMCEGYKLRQDKKWEIARWQVCLILNTKIKKGGKTFQPSELIELSIDRKEQKKGQDNIKSIYTPEEYAQLKRQLGIG
jgi:hypothetical protein